LRRLKPMDIGYNLIEEKLIGKEYEEVKERISIIEFLRRLKNKKSINKIIAIIGLEEILLKGEEVTIYIRKILSTSASMLRNHIIQFPIKGELILNRELKIRVRGREVRLTPIFGIKLKVKAPGYFHSPPII